MNLHGKYGLLVATAFSLLCPLLLAVAATETPKHLVLVSDPQYPWSDLTDEGLPGNDARAKELVELQYSDIADFRRRNGGASRIPVMINGDITAFGHGSERSYMKEVFERKLEGIYDYGLGNHDYANNVDDCFLNNCAAGSIVELKERYWGKADSMDLGIRSSGLGKIYYGSLAYSKNFGDVHMVQLHNEPTYAVEFSSGNPLGPTAFEITPALDWLERDLRSARQQGKIIILNMHKVYDWKGTSEQIARFQQMIETYRVTAIFGGHDHWGAGSWFDWGKSERFGYVPVFLSGSASQQTYLIASFSDDKQSLAISVVRGNNWPSRKVVQTIPVMK
ncbi:Metallophos domain-containing protein [Pseudomonas jessenii]|nr:metallophosphoesterase [Pseudomonas sp. BF-R-30]